MELAWHKIKTGDQDVSETDFHRFARFYPALKADVERLNASISKPDRIYAGDEFCQNRLPTPDTLNDFFRLSYEKGLPLTLLTPVLTDAGIQKCSELFDRLSRWDPGAEVVVNDLGVLFYLKKKYPEFRLSLGRLFNKGFKDPRLEETGPMMSEGMKISLNDCTFKRKNMRELAARLGIRRFEQDLLPHADLDDINVPGMKTSVYFPFGYVTTGRACLTAGLVRHPDTGFRMNNGCHSPCISYGLKLKHPRLDLELFQSGNTLFYRYTVAVMKRLLNQAESNAVRLVFQGGLI